MLQLINNTAFCAERACLVDQDGGQVWVVLVKATYRLNGDGSTELHPDQEPIYPTAIFLGDPERSSLLRDAEMVTDHPGTDITLLANAHAPRGYSALQVDVGVVVGNVGTALRVFGDRYWDAGVFQPVATPPVPFVAMPIVYERAFGGTNVVAGLPGQEESEPRNPVGQGFASSARTLLGRPLPNVEDPGHPIREWNDRPLPVGFGAIPPMWSPRREYAGTFDAAWKAQRMPLLPREYDRRHTLSAHPALVSAQPLRGGELVTLTNLTPGGLFRFQLPRPYLIVTTATRGGRLRQGIQLDRVIIEPDAAKLALVWRSTLRCGTRIRDVLSTAVDLKPRSHERGETGPAG